MRDVTGGTGPHAGQPIAAAGTPLAEAVGALILVHGRGGSADEMLGRLWCTDRARGRSRPIPAWVHAMRT